MIVTTYEKGIAKGREEGRKEMEQQMVTTYEKGIAKGIEEGIEKGIEKGIEQGRQQGLQEAARLLLERKFGPLSEELAARLAAWPAERLDELILAVSDAPSLHALGLAEDPK